MSHDVVIRGGQIVDGSGNEAFTGDVAIENGTITAIGKIDGQGKQEIDAEGHVVSPGFVDLHTHLDAQIGWDPMMTPISWHGVTTALMGNCGVTFAPCKPSDKELLASMMETVEDIPKEAILGGLAWDWEDYGGYLDSIERLNPALNVAGLVGHCAVRFYVMGERAVEEQATEDERKLMAEIVGHSLDRGAVGFSTNRYEPHKLADGRSIPGTFADPQELVEIAKQIGPRDGLMQAVGADFGVLKTLAETTQGRILFSFGAGEEEGSGTERRGWLEQLCGKGRDITAITQVRGSGFLFGLQSNLPFAGETWNEIRKLDFAGRLAALNNEDTYDKLADELRAPKSSGIPMNYVFYLGNEATPYYETSQDKNLKAISKEAGEHWGETFLRLSRETQGKALFNFRMFNRNIKELEELFKSEHIFPSLGDAGAHVSQIMDAGWTSFTLNHWIKGTGLYSLPEGIRRMTSGPARVLGLKDRGTLAEGMRADVNVFNLDNVSERHPEIVNDFPGGAPRYIQKSLGYKATLVNGTPILLDGELTGERGGQVLRHGS
ncbi:MAG: amidohydrolase family protein [Pseudomonadota bacterium]